MAAGCRNPLVPGEDLELAVGLAHARLGEELGVPLGVPREGAVEAVLVAARHEGEFVQVGEEALVVPHVGGVAEEGQLEVVLVVDAPVELGGPEPVAARVVIVVGKIQGLAREDVGRGGRALVRGS